MPKTSAIVALDAQSRYITPSDIRLLVERLGVVITENDADAETISEAVDVLKDFATLVAAGLRRQRQQRIVQTLKMTDDKEE